MRSTGVISVLSQARLIAHGSFTMKFGMPAHTQTLFLGDLVARAISDALSATVMLMSSLAAFSAQRSTALDAIPALVSLPFQNILCVLGRIFTSLCSPWPAVI